MPVTSQNACSGRAPKESFGGGRITGLILLGLVAVLSLAKGGYFASATCAAGVVACVVAGAASLGRRESAKRPLDFLALLFILLAVVYLLSALASGLTLTTVSELGAWGSVAGAAVLASLLGRGNRRRLLDGLCWVVASESLLAVLVFVGAVDWEYGSRLGRLQFPFQYANASAAWFGAGSFLCMLSDRRSVKALLPLPLVAMLLTKSAGAMAVFAALCVAVTVLWCRRRRWGAVVGTCAQGAAALAVFALLVASPTIFVGMFALALLCGCAAVYARFAGRLPPSLKTGRSAALLGVVTVAGIAVLLVAFGARLSEAAGHGGARLVYVLDASTMVADAPLLGVGPDNWQYVYPFYCTAQYVVSVVHCSYAQVACDAGLLGLGVLAVAVIAGCVRLGREGDWRSLCAALMVALHALVDFDLQFGALSFLLVALLCTGGTPRRKKGRGGAGKAVAVNLLASALMLVLCAAGLACALTGEALAAASLRGDREAAARLFASSPLVYDDIGARDDYFSALCAGGAYEEAVRLYEVEGVSTYRQVASVAIALAELGRSDEGCGLLVRMMELQPYSAELFRFAIEYVGEHGIPDDLAGRYVSTLNTANRLASQGNAGLLNDQVTFEVGDAPAEVAREMEQSPAFGE